MPFSNIQFDYRKVLINVKSVHLKKDSTEKNSKEL